MLWKIGGDGAEIGGRRCKNRARNVGMRVRIMGSVRDVMENWKRTVRNYEETVKIQCQKMWGCGLRFGMDSSKFKGIWCENRARNAGMRVEIWDGLFEIRRNTVRNSC